VFTSIASIRLRTLPPLAALLSGALAFQGANAYEAKAKAPADIVDTAVAAGSITTLATALEAAGLVETLKGPGPSTVFAPTDEAFAKLPAGTVKVDGANVVKTGIGASNGVIHVIDAVLLPK
jgi:uncharacterized surface protein with fasciclin (FAS1) repeats